MTLFNYHLAPFQFEITLYSFTSGGKIQNSYIFRYLWSRLCSQGYQHPNHSSSQRNPRKHIRWCAASTRRNQATFSTTSPQHSPVLGLTQWRWVLQNHNGTSTWRLIVHTFEVQMEAAQRERKCHCLLFKTDFRRLEVLAWTENSASRYQRR